MNRPAGIAAALLIAACSPSDSTGSAAGGSPPLTGARIGGPFRLIDQNGRTVTQASWPGQYRILYFGFSYCPDVCPTDLQRIGAGLRRFEGEDAVRGAKVVPIMVSVDPARDTPAVLKDYVAAFHPRMVGLTGSPEAIAAIAKAYGVYYARRENPGGEYLMDHSTQAYLMAPDGSPMALLPTEQGPDAIAAELAKWVR